tara:strand:- start:401 stop:760 length:360 start_codon:yes stop_codon:yes gene_type:complete
MNSVYLALGKSGYSCNNSAITAVLGASMGENPTEPTWDFISQEVNMIKVYEIRYQGCLSPDHITVTEHGISYPGRCKLIGLANVATARDRTETQSNWNVSIIIQDAGTRTRTTKTAENE